MDCDKVYDIENVNIKYMIASKDEIKSSSSNVQLYSIVKRNFMIKNLLLKL